MAAGWHDRLALLELALPGRFPAITFNKGPFDREDADGTPWIQPSAVQSVLDRRKDFRPRKKDTEEALRPAARQTQPTPARGFRNKPRGGVMADVVLSVLAHPDDAEFLCAGALIRLAQEHGWRVHVASMTPGDCGSAELPPEQIATIRRAEGARAAALIGGAYHCVEERDLRIFYEERPLERVTRLLRAVRPQLVLTHSPADYMLDHEITSTLVRAAAFGAPAPNFFRDRGHAPPLDRVPHLYYCDPIEGLDALGREVAPHFRVDVSGVIGDKAAMLAAHASQRAWLLKHHGMDQYVESMRAWGARRGREAGVAYAEGFRQHLGHGYPRDNLLGELLGAVTSRPSRERGVEQNPRSLGRRFLTGRGGFSTTQSRPNM